MIYFWFSEGDSGGPLLWIESKNPSDYDRPDVDASVVLTGIVSWGEVGAKRKYYIIELWETKKCLHLNFFIFT